MTRYSDHIDEMLALGGAHECASDCPQPVRTAPKRNDLARRLDRLHSDEARRLGQALYAMSIVVENFSADEDNPNVSAWLRGGAIDSLLKIQEELAELYY